MRAKKTIKTVLKMSALLSLVLLMQLPIHAEAETIAKHSIAGFDPDAFAATAKKRTLTHFTSGTGFYVGENYIVTNEHVVQGCKYIKVRGAVTPTYAKLQAVDKVNDLALLRTSATVGRVAQLRGITKPLTVGEDVTVIGYPLEYGIKGEYLVKQAVITDTDDYYDGTKRLQFTDSVEKGNSGGPLLDQNGDVVGVVVGKMSFYLADANSQATDSKPVKTSSMAIGLESLREFLTSNKIFFRSDNVKYDYPDKWMESKAKQYIVNVHCIKE